MNRLVSRCFAAVLFISLGFATSDGMLRRPVMVAAGQVVGKRAVSVLKGIALRCLVGGPELLGMEEFFWQAGKTELLVRLPWRFPRRGMRYGRSDELDQETVEELLNKGIVTLLDDGNVLYIGESGCFLSENEEGRCIELSRDEAEKLRIEQHHENMKRYYMGKSCLPLDGPK